jgi:hypothetical protein
MTPFSKKDFVQLYDEGVDSFQLVFLVEVMADGSCRLIHYDVECGDGYSTSFIEEIRDNISQSVDVRGTLHIFRAGFDASSEMLRALMADSHH